MKTIHKTLVVTATLILAGCGGGGSSSNNASSNDPSKIYKVEYTLNGSSLPTCPNAYDITTLPAQDEQDIGIHYCTWLCGDYQGSVMTVLLSFQQDGKNGIWEFDGEVLSTPPAECHR